MNGFGFSFQALIQFRMSFSSADAFVDAAALESVGDESEKRSTWLHPAGVGRGVMHVEAGMLFRAMSLHRWGLVGGRRLSQTRWMSRSAGTALSISLRNFLNSMPR